MTELPLGADARVESTSALGRAEALLWWRRAPVLPGHILGVVGGFQAETESATREVLTRATARLTAEGCTLAIGPMDGNTWRRYRLVTDPGTEPPFWLEPTHSPEWPEWWRRAGFEPLAEYYSSATDDLAARDDRVAEAAARIARAGIVVRALDPAHFEEELGRIHAVSVVAFRDNFLYTPVERDEFVAQYQALQAKVRPELVLLAEHAGRPVGFVFAVPDYAQAQRGSAVNTAIVKTLAVLPGRAYAGLGAVLLAAAHDAARRIGFDRAIHALMHESNRSRNLSAHYARTIRRYTLFARRLTG